MRTIALVGRSPGTRELSLQSSADEFWGVGVVYKDNVPQLDRLYELHVPWMLQHPAYAKGHWDWMKKDHGDLLIYMQAVEPEIPNSAAYPLAAAMDLCDGLYRGPDFVYQPVFTSSIDYMMAHAILEEVDRIEIYGIDLGIETEYIYQRPGFAFWIGMAVARGIEVIIPEVSPILKGVLYSYEGAQMVTRHQLEMTQQDYKNHEARQLSTVNALEGTATEIKAQWDAAPDDKELEKAFRAAWHDAQQARQLLFMYQGAILYAKFLIEECDMQEPDYVGGMVNPYSQVTIPNKNGVKDGA